MSCNKLSLTNSTSPRWEEKGNNNAVVRTYTWGLDISESSQGAGGVAGLLMVNAGSGGIHFPAYDLNGNVMGLVRYFKVENIGGSSCDTPIAENRYVSPFPLLSFKTPPSIIDLIARLIEYNISPMGLQEPNSDALKKEINSKKPKTFIEGEWLNGESPCENDSYFLENTLNFLIKLTPFYHY